jgi:hypothetical protein
VIEPDPAPINRPRPVHSQIWLRLYIAGATPNSARAEQNLHLALAATPAASCLKLTVIDVFKDGRRALADEVIVTPTLIANGPKGRQVLMGDLTDQAGLCLLITELANEQANRGQA